jgi:hypothetical protein
MKISQLRIVIIASVFLLVTTNLCAESWNMNILPHVAAGGGWTSYLTINDPHGVSSRTVRIYFYDDSGQPLPLKVDGVYQSDFAFTLAANQERTFVITADSDARSGQLQIASQGVEDLHSSLRFVYSDAMGNIIDAVGVLPTMGNYDWSFAIDKQTSTDNMGVAIANPRSGVNLAVSFDLYQNGARVPGTSSVTKTIAPLGHLAKFVSELFPYAVYSGTATLKVSSKQETFVAMALRADKSQYSSLSVNPGVQSWSVAIEGKSGTELWAYRFLDGASFYGACTNPDNPNAQVTISGISTGDLFPNYFRVEWTWMDSNNNPGMMLYQGTISREGGVQVIYGTRKEIRLDGTIIGSRTFKAIRTS